MIPFGGKQKFTTGPIQLKAQLRSNATGDGAAIIANVLTRHMSGDWGHGPKTMNDFAMVDGGVLVSKYDTALGTVQVVTDGARGSTLVGFEEEFHELE